MHTWSSTLDALVRERGPALTRYGYLLTGSTADAQDLVQEAVARVLARKPRLRDVVTLESYVRRVMLTMVVDEGRRAQRWRRVRHLVATPDEVPDAAAEVVGASLLETALATLSPRQRACTVLRYVEDLSGREIADALGVSEGAVKRYLSEANARMSAVLGPVDDQEGEHVVIGRNPR
ncbi:RNA polymerase sigma factor [Cellulomonas composti]|uniref:RNA polymerase sigma-E factor n=1 Tax=Cellulomonas composti TaxID=266130 RepID=A0A511J641_9CELL|nr:sigma-70 family RNA polymerase sigma factor [Cellulomonas composti]GEL93457.1 RNA polymerase sigma-E factor [Cellulomonas composti]